MKMIIKALKHRNRVKQTKIFSNEWL